MVRPSSGEGLGNVIRVLSFSYRSLVEIWLVALSLEPNLYMCAGMETTLRGVERTLCLTSSFNC